MNSSERTMAETQVAVHSLADFSGMLWHACAGELAYVAKVCTALGMRTLKLFVVCVF